MLSVRDKADTHNDVRLPSILYFVYLNLSHIVGTVVCMQQVTVVDTDRCDEDYLDPGERFDDPDEVLLQQVVIQLGQMGADDGVVPQLWFVLCKCLHKTFES